jgi:hypothetical protein
VRASDDYDIPDPTGVGWIRSNPVKHLEFVNRAQQRDDRAKNLVRLIKTWRFFNSVPVSSIYLEMRTAKRVLDVPPVIFLHDIAAVMREIAVGGLAAMNDPSDYDGRRIGPGCKDASEHASALAAFKVAAELATLARDAASAGDNAMACNYLSRLFAIRSN